MFRNWTFGRKVAGGFAVATLTIVLVAAFGYVTIHRLIENDALVSHTHEVRSELARFLGLMIDAETGQRGYLVTGAGNFLEPYQKALPEVDKALGNLRHMTSDNPDQQRRLDILRPAVDDELNYLKGYIDLRAKSGFEAVRSPTAVGKGKEKMDHIRRIIADMDDEERALLDRRREAAESSAAIAKAVILYGSLAGIVLLVFIGWTITRSLSQQIAAAVRHVQSSATELQTAANQQAASARQQATAMAEITTTISELLATSRQIAESAQQVAGIAEQTAGGARTGDSTVERGHEAIAAVRKQVDLIVTQMLDLGRKSQQVGAVLEIVSELAEQTNILAINATIEAAGAGETGKRFAVVADEIRRLADRVAGSAKDIRGLIDEVRSAANTTVMTTETGSKAVDAGYKQFADVAAAFKEIGGLVTATTESAKHIELSTKQQSTAVEQVNIAVTNVAQASKETEVSTGQMLQTAAELSGLSHDLLQLVQPQGRA